MALSNSGPVGWPIGHTILKFLIDTPTALSLRSNLNNQEQFILVADEDEMEEITRKLIRIGLDNIYGFVSQVDDLGIELQNADLIDLNTFKTHKVKNYSGGMKE